MVVCAVEAADRHWSLDIGLPWHAHGRPMHGSQVALRSSLAMQSLRC